jgi:hypothetical protein
MRRFLRVAARRIDSTSLALPRKWPLPPVANRARMYDPQRDPFFEALKADFQAGVDAIDRGETIPADEVWAHFEKRIAVLPKDAPDRGRLRRAPLPCA